MNLITITAVVHMLLCDLFTLGTGQRTVAKYGSKYCCNRVL